MRFVFGALVLSVGVSISACAPSPPPPRAAVPVVAPVVDRVAETRAITAVLDDLHDAAAKADEVRYFAHYASDAVFLGTDASERWDLAAFRAYAHPRFSAGHGWTFRATRRAVVVNEAGTEAWFDEDLTGEKLGPARGSGVLHKANGTWLVAQYVLSLTIPNERFDAVHALLDPTVTAARTRSIYDAAVAKATAGDVAQAYAELAAELPAAKARPSDASEFWLHNQLTWLAWGSGQPALALRHAEDAKLALLHGTLASSEVERLMLHALWDRAYLLRDAALAMHDEPKLLRIALDAKAEYDARAKLAHDDDGRNVLAAWFAVRSLDAKAALAAAKQVDAEKDDDLQDLWILAQAYELGKDAKTAALLRARVCAGRSYLMKPLLVRAMALQGHACVP
jgi:ketosteroid isomerase-like protein